MIDLIRQIIDAKGLLPVAARTLGAKSHIAVFSADLLWHF
jgi:hypothetical protein